MEKLKAEIFIERAIKKHGEKYSYSKLDYKGLRTKICIGCPKHGDFYQHPYSHCQGAGCPQCSIERVSSSHLKTKEFFIEKARKIHGDKYDYSKVIYEKGKKDVCIICPLHGEFLQSPSTHYKTIGCPSCSNKRLLSDFLQKAHSKYGDKYDYSLCKSISSQKLVIKCNIHNKLFKQTQAGHLKGEGCKICLKLKVSISKEEFLLRANLRHKERYDYSEIEYKDFETEVKIFCDIHGFFEQKPAVHCKSGCPKCGIAKTSVLTSLSTNEFISKCKKTHGERYDYSLTKYEKAHKKVIIICKEHGPFSQVACGHQFGQNCPECGKLERIAKTRKSTDEFVKMAKLVHGNEYDYSKVTYFKTTEKVSILCRRHGLFWQRPDDHIQKKGCPKCKGNKSQLEDFVCSLLDKAEIAYEKRNSEIISPKELDIYVPSKNIAIECNGLFWHSEFRGKYKAIKPKYHLDKSIKCYNKNINLIHLFEDKICNHSKLVISLLKRELNFGKKIIYRQNCEIKEISEERKSKFLNKYDLEGNCKTQYNLGIFYRDRLVSVFAFKKDKEFTLLRISELFNFKVENSVDFILNYLKSCGVKNLLIKINNNFPRNDIKRLNIPVERRTNIKCRYYLHGSMKRVTFYSERDFIKELTKLNLYDKLLSLKENYIKNKWNRIWDSGSSVYRKIL